MQKYLQDKQEHLKKSSQLLAERGGPARSLEDLRVGGAGGEAGPPTSLPAQPHLPLARFLCSSDSNLSQLEVAPLDPASHPLNR